MKKYKFPLESLLRIYDYNKKEKGIELSKSMQKWNAEETKINESDSKIAEILEAQNNNKLYSQPTYYMKIMDYIDRCNQIKLASKEKQQKLQKEIDYKKEEYKQANISYKKINLYKNKHKKEYEYNKNRTEQNIQDQLFSNKKFYENNNLFLNTKNKK